MCLIIIVNYNFIEYIGKIMHTPIINEILYNTNLQRKCKYH